jgi:RNA polymerase sigma-70 factor (ECF subfamily)
MNAASLNCELAPSGALLAGLAAMSEPGADGAVESDERLVAAAQAGDQAAFARLVRRHEAMLAGLLFRFAGRSADTPDLVQETFVRVYRQLPRWRPEAPFVHWLRRVAVNVGRDFCRARARRPMGDPFEDDQLAEPAGDKGADSAAAEVREVLAQLPPDDCVLLTLHFLEGMTFEAIGDQLGWSTVATRVRAFRARQKLKKLLIRHGYTP